MHSSSNLSRVKHEFRSDVKVDYGPLESQFANRMNNIFFAASDCSPDVDFSWFWRWVDEHCAHAGVQENNCACDSYNGRFCVVDEYGCGAGSIDVCPYELCRSGAVTYMLGILEALLNVNIAIIIVHVGQVLLNGLFLCYVRHNSLFENLHRSGRIKANSSNH